MALSGCASTGNLWTAKPADALGVWVLSSSTGNATGEIVIDDNGTFTSSGVPRNFWCSSGAGTPDQTAKVASAEDLDWDDPVAFSGTWDAGEDPQYMYQIDLRGELDSCITWRQGDISVRTQGLFSAKESVRVLRFWPNGREDEENYIAFKLQ